MPRVVRIPTVVFRMNPLSSSSASCALFGMSIMAHGIIMQRQFSATRNGERRKSPVYTRTGDTGSSSLYNGERRPKSDRAFEALGHQDELNAVLGLAREHCRVSDNGLAPMLSEIQSRLFDLGAAIATPAQTSSDEKKEYTRFPQEFTQRLEEWIDEIDCQLPPLTNFVIPSGGFSSMVSRSYHRLFVFHPLHYFHTSAS